MSDNYRNRGSLRWSSVLEAFPYIAIGAAIVITIVVAFSMWFGSRATHDCTVTDKEQTVEISTSGEGDDQTTTSEIVYYIYTEECGPLQLRNQLLLGQFNSAELYGYLTLGHTYTMETIGLRNGWLGWYPTIITATEKS